MTITAPTSFGHKPVEYVVIRDQEMIRRIGACKQMGGSQINGADTVVVVMVKTADKRAAEFWIEDGAIASAYILLAVEQYGLGACWVHIRNRMGGGSEGLLTKRSGICWEFRMAILFLIWSPLERRVRISLHIRIKICEQKMCILEYSEKGIINLTAGGDRFLCRPVRYSKIRVG